MKKSILASSYVATLILIHLLLPPNPSSAEPRAKIIELDCRNETSPDPTIPMRNFIATMENVSRQIQVSGFGMAAAGSRPDANYGLAQCYGDLSTLDCILCYTEARSTLPQCFPGHSGSVFLDGCFMRTENFSFFEEYTSPQDKAVCGNTTRKNYGFRVAARRAVEEAVLVATRNNGYARAQVPVLGAVNESAYVLVNCWRSLSAMSCRACLDNASASILGCLPWSEGRALNTGCFVRYSDINFLNPIPRNRSSKAKTKVIIVATIGSAILLAIGAFIAVHLWKQRTIQKKRKGSNDAGKLAKILHDSSLNFKYSTLEKATNCFDEANKLGQGGFATVYKGVLPDGREIAVKRLFFDNKHRAADFYNEVNLISSIEHKNLVRLLGCSCSGPESLLIYEYLPNKSLDRFLFDSRLGEELNWEKRFEIIKGAAEGLVYLHKNKQNKIIHRDIKASNILLDFRFRAKIADFGLARCFEDNKSHISTAIAGTLGYMAPEYLARGQLTEKADVYSFGILLLEIISGKQNNTSNAPEESESLLTTAWNYFQQKMVEKLFDPSLKLNNYHNVVDVEREIIYHNVVDVEREIIRVVHIGFLCTQEVPSLRPSMSKVLEMLVKKEEDLPEPSNPPYLYDTMELNDHCEKQFSQLKFGSPASNTAISHSILYPR